MGKTALLFAHGTYTATDLQLARSLPHDLVAAVDGGYRIAQHVMPHVHLFLGDVDSLPAEWLHEMSRRQTEIYRFPQDKDATDLELAALLVAVHGATTLHIFGALGGRWDHTLANLFLIRHPMLQQRTLIFHADGQRLYPIREHGIVQGHPGDLVSFLPLDGLAQGVTLRGFRYTLENGTLVPGSTLGVSNVLEAEQGEVWVASGTLLCIHTPQDVYARLERAKTLPFQDHIPQTEVNHG